MAFQDLDEGFRDVIVYINLCVRKLLDLETCVSFMTQGFRSLKHGLLTSWSNSGVSRLNPLRIQGFHIYNAETNTVLTTVTDDQVKITGLQPYTKYMFQVQPFTRTNSGKKSDPVSITTDYGGTVPLFTAFISLTRSLHRS